MFEPRVSRTWEYILQASQLLNFPESLKMRSINELPYDLREVDEVVDIVIDLSDL